MEPVNLDNTKLLERIAAALEDISLGMGRIRSELLRFNAFAADIVAILNDDEEDGKEAE